MNKSLRNVIFDMVKEREIEGKEKELANKSIRLARKLRDNLNQSQIDIFNEFEDVLSMLEIESEKAIVNLVLKLLDK